MPVVGNGSIVDVESARSCLRQSGADGLMIGRAAAATDEERFDRVRHSPVRQI